MHNKHISTPSFDGGMEQEQEIEITTAEITGLFHKCQKNIQVIAKKGKQAESSSQQVCSLQPAGLSPSPSPRDTAFVCTGDIVLLCARLPYADSWGHPAV